MNSLSALGPARSALRRAASALPLFALALLAAWPLVRYGPPLRADAITDGPNHLYRFALLQWHVGHGDLYPRWLSDVHYGFGGPVFNFYAPLSYYILLVLDLFSPSAPNTFLLGFLLAFVVAVFGAYYWARDQFDSHLAGLAAAAAYLMTPYLYYSVLERAAYPVTWGLAIAPWLFWLALRLSRRPSGGVRLTFVTLYAAFILVHNFSALLFTPLLAAYLLMAMRGAGISARRSVALAGLSLAHGIGLAAFFLLPFFMEARYVQLDRAATYAYGASFMPLRELFSPPVPFDPSNVANSQPASVPWPQALLAALALGLTLFRRAGGPWGPAVAFNGLSVAVLVWLMHPSSAALWEAGPLSMISQFVQFSFRWLGPATLLLAWLSAAGVASLPRRRLRLPAALAFIASVFVFSLPWTYREPYSRFPDVIEPADVIRDEIAHPSRVGTTNLREFLPRWVSELPAPDAVLPRYSERTIPSRLAPVPADVRVTEESAGLTSTRLRYQAAEPFRGTFHIFYFPGWSAFLDGERLEIRPAGPHGLIAMDLPAGGHSLRLALRPTPPQWIGGAISLVCLGLLAAYRGRRVEAVARPATLSPLGPSFALLFLGLLGARLFVFDRGEHPFYRSALKQADRRVAVNFGDQLELIGIDFPQGGAITAGRSGRVRLFWRALRPLESAYHTSVQLVDRYGHRFGQSDNYNPGALPAREWRADRYAVDEHRLEARAGSPPGEYRLMISVSSIDVGGAVTPLAIHVNGTPGRLFYEGETTTVVRAPPQPPGPLRLVDASLAVSAVGVGEQIPFTLLWNSGSRPLAVLTANVALTDSGGDLLFSADLPPAGPDYTTDRWTANELVLYPHSLTLPPDMREGPARVTVALVGPDRAVEAGPYELGTVTVTVPERSFLVPPMAHVARHDFEGAVRLLGYDVTAEGIALYWQALRAIPDRLTVFVHAFDDGGAFVGGHDDQPVRPTTSWLPGEVIVDFHPVVVGNRFDVGLYDSETLQRFGVPFRVGP